MSNEECFVEDTHDEMVVEDGQIATTSNDGQEGNSYIYADEDGEYIVDNVVSYVEVEADDWSISESNPTKSPPNKRKLINCKEGDMNFRPPPKVLMTAEDLKPRPQMYAAAGRRSPNSSNYEQWHRKSDRASLTSGGSLPSMRPLFRMCGQAILRKADASMLQRENINEAHYSDHEIEPILNERRRDSNEQTIEPETEETNIVEHCQTRSLAALESLRSYVQKRKQQIFAYKDWPLYWDRPIDFQEACEILCGSLIIDEKLICTNVPIGYRSEGTFIVDLRNFDNRHDVNNDGMCSWGVPSLRSRYFNKANDGRMHRCDDGKGHLVKSSYLYKCMCKRYEHPATVHLDKDKRFIKKIYTAVFPVERQEAVGIAIVTYEWTGTHSVDFPISNSRPVRCNRQPAPTRGWEKASFGVADEGALPATVCAFFGDLPIYSIGAVDFNTAASIILGGIKVDPSRICTSVPQRYREAGSFVVNLENLGSEYDLRRDDNGIWAKPASHSRFYKLDESTNDAIRVDRGNKLIDGASFDIQVLCKRYYHPSVNGRFVRKIYTGKDFVDDRINSNSIDLAVIVYYWKGEPEYFEAQRQNKVHMITRQPRIITEEENISAQNESYAIVESLPSTYQQNLPNEQDSSSNQRKPHKSIEEMDENELDEFQKELLEIEFNNQAQLSHILDRVEQAMDRFEAMERFV